MRRLIILATLACAGCSPRIKPEPYPGPVIPVIASTEVGSVGTLTVYLFKARGCDYLAAEGAARPAITHAGDCRNSIHGRRIGSGPQE